MRHLFFVFTLLSLTVSVSSQVQFNIFAGPQASSSSYNILNVKQKQTYKYGFQLGMGMKVPFETNLYFSPALYYSMKGYKVKFNQYIYPPGPEASDNNTTIHTVETAFLLQYDFSNNPGHWFFKTGPSLDFQLVGKEKFNTTSGLISRSMKYGYEHYGRYSANWVIQLGREMSNGFFIFGQYSHGMANISNVDLGPRIRHLVFNLSIGKMFDSKKIVIDTRNKQ